MVGEVDSNDQFHQCFTHTFFLRKHTFGAKISYKSALHSFVIFGAKILAKKVHAKWLVKMTPVADLIKKNFFANEEFLRFSLLS